MSLVSTSQQIIVYSGIVLFLVGITGNTMNIIIFSNVPAYRRAPAAFYFLIESIFKCIFLLVNLPPRIIAFSFGYDFANMSVIWCKTRQYLLMMSSATAISCICLSTIDQYFVTSSNPSLRRMSQIKWSRRIVIIVIITWCLHAIPFCLYFNISPITKTCISTNRTLSFYIPIYFLLVVCTTPVLIISIFTGLAYRNIRRTAVPARQRADRQLIQMTLMQVILVLLCITQLGGWYVYTVITSGTVKNQDQMLKEYLIYAIISTETTLYYSGSFYVFVCTSSRFRQTIKEFFFARRRSNTVHPPQQT
ncbi:unnamed protein product [Adineta ricciae]|uniref:G-protein coupled receptors family 1 profile domain-containing protein n=1 Tax=Adineta ricciae TaxID=249248 RepID=A0A815EGJ5_ADIRI|nr:unnamed protein product [Adineta ricciae]CAF1314796.1 unnamed protein product [Adineta ricciae]